MVPGVRRVDEAAVGIERQRAVQGTAVERCRQGLGALVPVAVVRQDARRGDGEGRVLDRFVGVVDGDGRVVDRRHRQRDHGRIRDARVVHQGRAIGETIYPVEVRSGGVDEPAVGVERHRAVRRSYIHGQRHRVRGVIG